MKKFFKMLEEDKKLCEFIQNLGFTYYKNKFVMYDKFYYYDRLRGLDVVYDKKQDEYTLHGCGTYRRIDLTMYENVNEIMIDDAGTGMFVFLKIDKRGSYIELNAKTSDDADGVDVQLEYYDKMVQFYDSNVIDFPLGQGMFEQEEYFYAIKNLITKDKTGYMKVIIDYIKQYNMSLNKISKIIESQMNNKTFAKNKK